MFCGCVRTIADVVRSKQKKKKKKKPTKGKEKNKKAKGTKKKKAGKQREKHKKSHPPEQVQYSVPDDVLLDIFRLLLPEDLLACRLTCSQWSSIASGSGEYSPTLKAYLFVLRALEVAV